jgi:hypothetical protein
MRLFSLALAIWGSLTVFVDAGGATARAQDYEATGGTERPYAHGGQFKLYSQFGAGYRIIFRYEDEDFCGTAGKTVCRSFTPPWIELGVGYGITDAFEVLVDLRLGLGDDFKPDGVDEDAPKQFVISPGIRVFIDDAGSLKFFTTFQVAIDRTDFEASGISQATDIGLRNVNGLLVDLHRTFGIYVHVGETISFVRWLRFEIDAGVGMMVRVP